MKEIRDDLDNSLKLYCWTSEAQKLPVDEPWAVPLAPAIAEVSPEIPNGVEKGGFHDKLVYIYTSGTTGLPKAAVVTNSRCGIEFVTNGLILLEYIIATYNLLTRISISDFCSWPERFGIN